MLDRVGFDRAFIIIIFLIRLERNRIVFDGVDLA